VITLSQISLKKAQEIVDSWIDQFEEGYWPPLSMLASIVEEVGELAREINDLEGYKKKKVTEKKKNLGLELADVIFRHNLHSKLLQDRPRKSIQRGNREIYRTRHR